MVMDIYGRAPINKIGEYFRRNISGWDLIPTYIDSHHPEFMPMIVPPVDPDPGLPRRSHTADVSWFWGSNDGYGLPADAASALADLLDADVASGIVDAWINDFHVFVRKLPRETCPSCDGTGVRSDPIAVSNAMASWVVEGPDGNPRVGQTGSCNACHGWGSLPSSYADYELEPENLTEFAAFMRASGGFEIW